MDPLQRTMLILEDSAEDAATFRRYLERDRDIAYRCHVASTAAEGLELCRSLRPDAILVDYNLPDSTGLAFLKELIAEHGALAFAVVMITGVGNEAVAVQALKLGAHDYLVKAQGLQQRLLVAIAGAIDKVTLQRQVEQQRRDLASTNERLKQALDEQQASAAQLRMALLSARMATWNWDLATNQVRWGEALEEMMHLPLGQFGGSIAAFEQLVHPDDLGFVRQRLDQALHGDVPYEVEFRMLRPDGSLRWTATRGAVVRDPQGAAIGMLGVDMDVSDRKQAEMALRASEVRARVMWESATDAMALSDAEGIVLEANQAYCDLYGYSPEQVIGHSFAIIFPPEQRVRVIAQYREVMQTRMVLPIYEATIQRANGEERVVESRATIVVTSNGQHALLSIIRDITERRKIENQLRRSESQFKTLVENAPDIIARFDSKLRHLYVSPTIERVTGLSQAAYIGKTNRELGMPDEQCELWDSHSEYVFRTRQSAKYEFEFSTPEGQISHYQATLVPEFAEHGTVETVLAITRDVTAYKEAAKRLAFLANAGKVLTTSLDYQVTLQQLARLAIPYLGDACIIDLVDGKQVINTVVAHIDAQSEDLLREISRKYPPALDGSHPVAQVLRTGQPLVVDHISPQLIDQVMLSDDHRAFVEQLPPKSCMLLPLMVRDQIIGVIALYSIQGLRRYSPEDRTVLDELARRAAIALDNAQLYQEAQEAIREREAFLAVASHEIKNPLTTLFGRSQTLQRRLERRDDAARELFDVGIIIDSSQRINHLISDLLDASRMESGQLSVDPVPLDLGRLIHRVAAQIQSSAPDHRITISEQAMMLAVAGDSRRLEQVFQNLFTNAIKYSPAGGVVEIEIAMRDARARISVRDNGMGIPADALPHLFKRFYRVSRASNEQISGSGIGLYIVKEIVANHGGTVEVSSTEDVGSTFTVSLPLATLQESSQPA